MAKKRAREVKATDTQLIEIYEDLANENEEFRLKAAHTLLTKFSDPAITTLDQHKVIVGRLFRGLCSGRKAARLGFSIAVTEFLSRVFQPYLDKKKISALDIIDNLESQTALEGGTSGQDERDHYFGTVFGAEAIIKSSILFTSPGRPEAWRRLLKVLLGLAKKKPWLRQECGWLLYSCISSLSADFAIILFEELASHELILTPEGVAIWLEVNKHFPSAKSQANMPKHSHSWKHGDPLHYKDSVGLADIMRDAKFQQAGSDSDLKSQGSGVWSAQLHFAWDVVLRELYNESGTPLHGKSEHKGVRRIEFEKFWRQVVDDSLFASASSTERKHWGFLLIAKVLSEAPERFLHHIFSPNATKSLINNLNGHDRYLQRSAQKAVQAIQHRASREPVAGVVCLQGLIVDAGIVHFDKITKTKTIEKLLNMNDLEAQSRFQTLLCDALYRPNIKDPTEAIAARKAISDFLVQVSIQGLELDYKHKQTRPIPSVSKAVMQTFVLLAYFELKDPTIVQPAIENSTRLYIRGRMMSCLDQALRFGSYGRGLLGQTVAEILTVRKTGLYRPVFEFDDKIEVVVQDASRRIRRLSHGSEERPGDVEGNRNNHDSNHPSTANGSAGADENKSRLTSGVKDAHDTGMIGALILLYHLTLLQVFSGEPEAVEILEDLNSTNENAGKDNEGPIGSDALVEILLSFASKPSKFMRRISLQAFAAFASEITSEGLQSMTRVLETKETLQGQDEMFDAEADGEPQEDIEGLNGDADDSDVEMTDSDVELLEEGPSSGNGSNAEAKVSGNETGTSSGEEDNSEAGEDDEELAIFDAKLAAALGTRKGEEDIAASDTSGSDEDMSDSEMEALDEKLAEVFRARKDLATKPRKKDQKSAKENIVNFKNRVLDFVDFYLKQESATGISLLLVLPLLRLHRKTNVKQLADRAGTILREFCARSKGPRLPKVLLDSSSTERGGIERKHALEILKEIHTEAGLGGSNAHASVCSSASILFARALTTYTNVRLPDGAGTGDLEPASLDEIVDIYGSTRKKFLKDKNCAIQPSFFTDWNNWCVTTRKSLAM